MRFDLIDRVIERDADTLVAVKSVTNAEEYLADHFPGFPVLPGVMMLETLVQAARNLINADQPLILAQVRNLRYGNMVQPGQTLTVRVTIRSRHHQHYELEGRGTVHDRDTLDNQVAVQGRFRLEPVPPDTA